MKPVLMALTAATLAGGAHAAPSSSPLGRYVDHARVLVISATTADDPDIHRQDAALVAQGSGLKARDIVVVRAIGPAARGPAAEAVSAADIRAAVGLPAGRFGVALVGKDGGVKLRQWAPLSAEGLFGVIDAMPMRREEMRRAKSG